MNKGDIVYRRKPAPFWCPLAGVVSWPGEKIVIIESIDRPGEGFIIPKADFNEYYQVSDAENCHGITSIRQNAQNNHLKPVFIKNICDQYERPSRPLFVNPEGVQQRIF